MTLSKSLFLDGLQCKKKLWLKTNRRELDPAPSPALQAIFDEGHAVGKIAREYFPGGKLIETDHPLEALTETKAALKAGASLLYEPAFEHQDFIVRPDIMRKSLEKPGSWELIEVKSVTGVEDVHAEDVAIQSWVVGGAGISLVHRFLMHVNTEYVRQDSINIHELFALEIMDDVVAEIIKTIPMRIQKLLRILTLSQEPSITIGQHCSKPYNCTFESYCWRDIPDYSIHNITRLLWAKRESLRELGILLIKDVPDNFPLSNNQLLQVAVEKSQIPYIDAPAIHALTSILEEPLCYLDFETINPALPLFCNLRPYEKMPFQFSLRLYEGEKERQHIEYLGDGINDPRPEIARLLAEQIPNKGSIIVYHASFEGNVLKSLAQMFPQYAEALLSINRRLWDLEAPFSKRHIVHPRFRGSSSIKQVLPALVPDMTYEDLEIGEGSAASRAYIELTQRKLATADAQRLREELLRYCGQDTLAMVRLLKVLKGL